MLIVRGSCVFPEEGEKETYIKQAISDAVDSMDNDLPLMMQLCKIKEATNKGESMFDENFLARAEQLRQAKLLIRGSQRRYSLSKASAQTMALVGRPTAAAGVCSPQSWPAA